MFWEQRNTEEEGEVDYNPTEADKKRVEEFWKKPFEERMAIVEKKQKDYLESLKAEAAAEEAAKAEEA